MDARIYIVAYIAAALASIERGLSWLLQTNVMAEYLMVSPGTPTYQVAQVAFLLGGIVTVLGAVDYLREVAL